jgi:hypothetical protein
MAQVRSCSSPERALASVEPLLRRCGPLRWPVARRSHPGPVQRQLPADHTRYEGGAAPLEYRLLGDTVNEYDGVIGRVNDARAR